MPKRIEGQLSAEGMRFALVAGRFNSFMTDKLVEGALDCLRRHGAREDDITEIRVPGSFEVPFVAQQAARAGHYDAVVCLGAIIRGGTPHFDFIAAEAAKGVAQVGLSTGVPTIFGILTTDTLEQAIERSGTKSGNRGWEAALAAIELVDLGRRLQG
jgi:6,7-dimethyl-8-ribityllumazine synthase